MDQRDDVRMIVVAGELTREDGNARAGEDEGGRRRHEIRERQRRRESAAGARLWQDHDGAEPGRLMTIRTRPGSVSSVSWVKPRSSRSG